MQGYDLLQQKHTKQNQHRGNVCGASLVDTRCKLPESSPVVMQTTFNSPARRHDNTCEMCTVKEQNGEIHTSFMLVGMG